MNPKILLDKIDRRIAGYQSWLDENATSIDTSTAESAVRTASLAGTTNANRGVIQELEWVKGIIADQLAAEASSNNDPSREKS